MLSTIFFWVGTQEGQKKWIVDFQNNLDFSCSQSIKEIVSYPQTDRL